MSPRIVACLFIVLAGLLPLARPAAGPPSDEAEQFFRKGLEEPAYSRQRLKLVRQAASKGHPLSAAWAGRMLYMGRGQARTWLRKAADLGHEGAKRALKELKADD
jgi:TPR repeat protein